MAWPDFLEATSAASVDDLNIITQFNAMLEESMDQEQGLTALTTRVADLETANVGWTLGLKIVQSRVSPNTDILVTAVKLPMSDGTALSDVSVTLDLGDAGAGGLDAGTVAADSWYYAYVAGDSTGDNDPVGIWSLSLTPTLPSGYDIVSAALVVLPTDSNGYLHAFSYLPTEGTVTIWSNETDADHGAMARISLAAISQTDWSNIDLSAMQPPGCTHLLVRFVGAGVAGADQTHHLYGKPTWAIGGASVNYQRRILQLRSEGDFGSAQLVSADVWIELDDDGQFAFTEADDDWGSIYAALVGYKFNP